MSTRRAYVNPHSPGGKKCKQICQVLFWLFCFQLVPCVYPQEKTTIVLPPPRLDSNFSLEKSLFERRTKRDYLNKPISLKQLSQLLWAAQGITSPRGFRTAPSAGALYPLELYIVVGNVSGLTTGVYHYLPHGNRLEKIMSGDKRLILSEAALYQPQVAKAAVNIVITAIFDRTTNKYGKRGTRYVYIEVGHVGQNICLQATALNLGVCPIGAFEDSKVSSVLKLSSDTVPVYILSVGRCQK